MNSHHQMDMQNSANDFDQKFNQLFSQLTEEVGALISKSEPNQALEKVMAFIGMANLYAQIKISIINKLTGIIGQLKQLLANIASKLNAASYSIGVSAPIGISVSITWNV